MVVVHKAAMKSRPTITRSPSIKKMERMKTKKSVRFSSFCQVVTLSTSSKEDSSKMWYVKQDYDSMRNLCKQDVVAFAIAMKSGTTSKFDTTRLRGLEHYFPRTKKQELEQRKKQRVHAILGQQFMQRSTGGAIDPDSLAFLSEFLSRKACDRAVEMARRDAMIWLNP